MKKKIAFAMMMGILTTGMVSLVLISVTVGFVNNFFLIWLKAWGLAYLVAVPTILIFGSQVQQLVDKIFDEELVQ